jgi:hypothetical protein
VESGGQFNVVDPRTGWKVDLIVCRDRDFSRGELARRVPAKILGIRTYIATAEDTILTKLEWSLLGGSELQRRDVTAMIRARGGELDDDYLDQWAGKLGVRALLDEARGAAAEET